MNPLPKNLGQLLNPRYKKVLVPELNTGQLRMLLRSEFGRLPRHQQNPRETVHGYRIGLCHRGTDVVTKAETKK